jgi:hypothetical protein
MALDARNGEPLNNRLMTLEKVLSLARLREMCSQPCTSVAALISRSDLAASCRKQQVRAKSPRWFILFLAAASRHLHGGRRLLGCNNNWPAPGQKRLRRSRPSAHAQRGESGAVWSWDGGVCELRGGLVAEGFACFQAFPSLMAPILGATAPLSRLKLARIPHIPLSPRLLFAG